MTRTIFVNLPVVDLAKATAFYEAIGARKDERFCDGTASAVALAETIVVMLLTHEKFSTFTPKPISDARKATEVLLAISADSRADVDALVETAGRAGGRMDPAPKQDLGFMYGRSFEDLDGHIWEVFWMDVEAAMPAIAATRAPASV